MTNAKQIECLARGDDAAVESNSSWQLARAIAEAADDRKAADIVILKIGDVSYLADYFVIATGFSRAQVRAIADAVAERAEAEFGQAPLRVDGASERSWIVLDFGDTIAHVLLPEERDYYNIEAFWGHAERLEFARDEPTTAL